MEIDQIFASISLIIFAIMVIGFWTFADYYTNLNIGVRKVYWFFHLMMYAICLMGFLIMADKPGHTFMDSVNVASRIISIFTQVFLLVTAVILTIAGLIKSHLYFGRKRNKL